MLEGLMLIAVALAGIWFIYNRQRSNQWQHKQRKQRQVAVAAAARRPPNSGVLFHTLADLDRHILPESMKKSRHPFHSVAIVCDGEGCKAQAALAEQRFLSSEAPNLPLQECDAKVCQCRYQHFDDRRTPGSDRRDQFSIESELYGRIDEDNRRIRHRGRRHSDC